MLKCVNSTPFGRPEMSDTIVIKWSLHDDDDFRINEALTDSNYAVHYDSDF